jgi:hypothetical protein
VLRQGPFSAFVHGAVEYAASVLFVVAPFLFSFDSEAAKAISIVVGVGLLVITASSELPTGLAKVIPITIHAVLDVVMAGFLIAAPFLFGFSEESGPTAFFIALGLVHLLLTIGTRFLPARQTA